MSREHFDLIIGLGPACSCTMSLRRAGLQHLSFPYDWIGPKENSDEYLHDVRLDRRLVDVGDDKVAPSVDVAHARRQLRPKLRIVDVSDNERFHQGYRAVLRSHAASASWRVFESKARPIRYTGRPSAR